MRIRLLAGIGCLAVLTACGGKPRDAEPVLRPVRFETVYTSGAGRTRTFTGVAAAGTEARLSFKVPGTVRRIPVKVGDTVQAGDLLAELDPQDFELQVEEAAASLTRAQAEARNAEADYDRVRKLYENDNASLNDLDAARAGSESAKAQVASLEKRLEMARLQRGYARLSAPMAGAVASVDVDVNENVSAGKRIVLLTSGGETEVEIAVPEALIAAVHEGDTTSVQFDALPGRKFRGRVTEVAVAATGGATTYPVTVRVEGDSGSVLPGMAATVALRFAAGGGRERILVPPGAVGEDTEGRFVFVVEPDGEGTGTVHRRAVTVGDLTDEGMEIEDGLADGDRVVTAGVTKLQDGVRVKLET